MKNLFEKAKEAARFRHCDGCNEKKHIDSFKKGNKYCSGCPKVEEIKKRYE